MAFTEEYQIEICNIVALYRKSGRPINELKAIDGVQNVYITKDTTSVHRLLVVTAESKEVCEQVISAAKQKISWYNTSLNKIFIESTQENYPSIIQLKEVDNEEIIAMSSESLKPIFCVKKIGFNSPAIDKNGK